jgi:hypothetical protein
MKLPELFKCKIKGCERKAIHRIGNSIRSVLCDAHYKDYDKLFVAEMIKRGEIPK